MPFAVQEKGDTNSKGENGIENEDERKIFSILVETPDITAKGMSEHTGFSVRKINRIMKGLKEKGIIVRVGSDRKGYWEIQDKAYLNSKEH